MADEDGPRIAGFFYKEMLKRDSDGEGYRRAGRALWMATQRMKDMGIPMSRWANFVHYGA